MSYPPSSSGYRLKRHALVAGATLHDEVLVEEVATLLDATDRRCGAAMRGLRDEGLPTPISAVVQATYAQGFSAGTESDALPASVVVQACERAAMDRKVKRWTTPTTPAARPKASALWRATDAKPRWGRLYAALLVTDPNSADDLALLPDLLEAAWVAGGYHLRLEALTAVHDNAGLVDEATRHRIGEVLGGLDDPGHVFLSTALVDALAAYDAIEPVKSADDIRAEITAVLAEPDDPAAWAVALGVIGAQFDNESVLGPYSEVISELDDRRMLRLHLMAARHDQASLHRDWLVGKIVDRLDHTDDATRQVAHSIVLGAAMTIDTTAFMPQEAVGAHLQGLRGWVRIADRLPEPASAADDAVDRRAWRTVDELLFALLRGEPIASAEADRLWAELLGPCAPAAVDVLFHLRTAHSMFFSSGELALYDRLVTAYPEQVLSLLEWGLANRGKVISTMRGGSPDWREQVLLGELERLGTTRTAELLRGYVSDPTVGSAAVEAIRAIERRG